MISSWGGSRYIPMAFTEQGVAMLSGVLNSDRAIAVNIQIMRTFTRLRQALLNNEDLKKELSELKRLTEDRFSVVFETLDQLLAVEYTPAVACYGGRKALRYISREQLIS